MNFRLRPLLLVVLISFTALLICLTTTMIYVFVSRTITEEKTVARVLLLEESLKQLTERFRGTEEMALSIATHPELLHALSDTKRDTLESLKVIRNVNEMINRHYYSKAYISSVTVYSDRFGFASRLGQDRIVPLAHIPWTKDAERLDQADSVWIGGYTDPWIMYDPPQVVTYIRKIYSNDGEAIGYLEVNVVEESLYGLLLDREKKDSSVLIMDSGGRLISSRPEHIQDAIHSDAESHSWFSEMQRNPTNGSGKALMNGQSNLLIYTSPNYARWRIAEMIPTHTIEAPIDELRNLMLGIGLLGILVSLPLSFYLSRRIIRPIPELLTSFRKMESGNFNASISENNSVLEIRLLSQNFNRMVRQLQELIASNQKEQQAKQEAEMRVLQSQINPHFLYNTLDLVNWMAARQGAHNVSQVVTMLAKYFRISLSNGKTFIKLGEELEHSRLYVQIQQVREKGPFRFAELADETLKSLIVPKMILQPLIENAINHGFPDGNMEGSEIVVHARLTENRQLCVAVEDNGVGLDGTGSQDGAASETPFFAHRINGQGGYGIGNIRDRIRLYFGRSYGVRLMNREPSGTIVEIVLPVIRSQEELAKFKLTGDEHRENPAGG